MSSIKLLDKKTSDLISAGEVVERPANVLKELIENSIDAGANTIFIELEDGGISKIQITDNGCGINADDMELSIRRFATSKINNISDLNTLSSLGFRGEALSSIASVSKLSIQSGVSDKPGYSLRVSAGEVIDKRKIAQRVGTSIAVEDLFYNVPARKKFLKSSAVEFKACMNILNSQIISNFEISFVVIHNGKEIINLPKASSWLERLKLTYRNLDWKYIVPASYSNEYITISGFVSLPEAMTKKKDNQVLIINNRVVQNKTVSQALYAGFKGMVIHGLNPVSFIRIDLDPGIIDVNVHPKKAEVKFNSEFDIYNYVFRAVNSAVLPEENTFYKHNSRITDNKSDDSVPFKMSFDIPISENTFSSYADVSDPNKEINSFDFKLLGQLKKSYILLETQDEFWIVDQHAAHERIQYEKLKNLFNDNKSESQRLLVPVLCKLSESQKVSLNDSSDLLKSLGFEFDFLDDDNISIDSIPSILRPARINSDFIDSILDDFNNATDKKSKVNLIDEKLKSMACRSAVMFGDSLTNIEMMDLVQKVIKLKIPYCPHGRPAILRLSDDELVRMFKRVI